MKLLVSILLLFVSFSELYSQYSLSARHVRFLRYSTTTNDYTNEIRATNGYEMLCTDRTSADLFPMVLFANLGTTSINSFKVRIKISNEATGYTLFAQQLTVDSSLWRSSAAIVFTDANGTPNGTNPVNIPAGSYFKMKFPKIALGITDTNKIGLYKIEASVVPQFSDGTPFTDADPADDTTRNWVYITKKITTLDTNFVVNKISNIASTEIVLRSDGLIVPSPLRFISKGADVISGDSACYASGGRFPSVLTQTPNAKSVSNPVIRMNRRGFSGEEPVGVGGDTLISYPIDIRGRKEALLVLEVQRAGRIPKQRNWADSVLYGPEHRVTDGTTAIAALRESDDLVVEFATPTVATDIANTATWNIHPRTNGGSTVTDNPALTIFGGGGKRLGVKDVGALGETMLTRDGGLRVDYSDAGKDEEFVRYVVQIPDTLINYPNNGGANFRFRLRVAAKRDGNLTQKPFDDEDNFYVRSISIVSTTDVNHQEVAIVSNETGYPKYTLIPKKQSSRVPLRVKIANNSLKDAQSFNVNVEVKKQTSTGSQSIYSKIITIPFLPGSREVWVPFPDWNNTAVADTTKREVFSVISSLTYPTAFNEDASNDSIITPVTFVYGDCFAFDTPDTLGKNDVPKYYGLAGSGIGSDRAAQLKVRFTLPVADTIFGFQALWGEMIADTSLKISMEIQDANFATVPDTKVLKNRGVDEVTGETRFGKYSTMLLRRPVLLQAGTYYVVANQLGVDTMAIGATASRTAFVSTAVGTLTTNNKRVPASADFRTYNNALSVWNNEFPSYLDTNKAFAPTTGTMLYPHIANQTGRVNGYDTYTNATWIPALRPFFPEKRSVFIKVDTAAPIITSRVVGCASYTLSVLDSIIPSITLASSSKNVTMKLDTVGKTVTAKVSLVDSTTNGIAVFIIKGLLSKATQINQQVFRAMSKPVIEQSGNVFTVNVGTKFQWYLNGTAIPGATQYSYVPTQSGTYYVLVKDDVGCEGESDSKIYIQTSVEEFANPLGVALSPNPTSDHLNITLHTETAEGVRIEVVDALGAIVHVYSTPNTTEYLWSYAISTRSFASGRYTIRVISGARVVALPLNVIH